MVKRADDRRFESGSMRRFADADLALTHLRVTLRGELVGTLAATEDGVLAFQYADSWIEDGFSISPFSLPLERKVFVADPHPLGGVFGVFDDSLPDGWGRLLVDRTLREHGVDPFSVGPFTRLAIVGKGGMGALEYEPEICLAGSPALDDLDEIAAACAKVLSTDYSDDLDALFALGGSSGGARPKILTAIDGEDWIVKFPSSCDGDDIGAEEFAFAGAARACGIEMPQVRLLPSKRCLGYFAIRRFDRARDQHGNTYKTHMASAGALLEASHRTSNLDYDLLMRLTLRLSDDMEEVKRLFRLMLFNVFAGNRDDHAKNFTFLHEDTFDSWTLSPAYDLTRNFGINGKHATMVNGKGSGITHDDLLAAGVRAGLPPRSARAILGEVEEAVRGALEKLA